MMWLIRRLKTMSLAEVVWRAQTAVNVPIDWLVARRMVGQPTRVPQANLDCLPADYPIRWHADGNPIVCTHVFDLEFDAKPAFDWHKDYSTGRRAPEGSVWGIDVRNQNVTGDIKYIWEINRHQYLSALAYSKADAPLQAYIVGALRDWIEKNPFMHGVNWSSSLELGLRLISWAFIYPAIKEHLSQDPDGQAHFFRSIYLHQKRIAQHFSRFSSANNHLIGEAAGLYVASTCFPAWTESRRWQKEARAILEREIQIQVTAKGVNREQAMGYQLFTLEFFLLVYVVGRNSGDPFSAAFADRVQSMLAFLNQVMTTEGDLPWFGDSDDGRAFLLSKDESSVHTLLQLGGLVFREKNNLTVFDRLTCASKALLNDDEIAYFHEPAANVEHPHSRAMLDEEAGIAVLTSQNQQTKVVMDVGPLGYTSIAAHGHADALSVLMAVDGQYVLIDPGTYAYHSHPEWRTYFRGTSAHNTARVDGVDQSMIGGRFLWSTQARTRLLTFQDEPGRIVIDAEHDGYTRLDDPVVHRRTLAFDPEEEVCEITDLFACEKEHNIEVFFHFHEAVTPIEVDGKVVRLSFGQRELVLSISPRVVNLELCRGSDNPILGWRSRSFSRKFPVLTVRIAKLINGSESIITTVTVI